MVEEQRYYKLSEVAKILGRSKWVIWNNYVKSGKIKAAKLDGVWIVSKDELERFVGHSITSDKPQKEFLTTRDCGEILSYDMWTIRRYIHQGIDGLFLKAQKVNGVWMVHKTDLDNFIKERMGN